MRHITQVGTEGAKETDDKYPRSLFFRKLVRQASSVFYSSATYAKRPRYDGSLFKNRHESCC